MKGGHLQCLKQLYNDGYVIDKLAADHAAANGNIECAEYIAEKCTYVQEEWRHFSIASYSELRYFISIITKLRQNLSPPELTKFIKSNSHHVCRDAIKKNKPDILEYFIILCRSMDINIGNCCVYIACKCGNLECLKILTKYNYKSEQRLYEACISNGRLDMIEYLLNNDHVINEKDYLCDLAIQHNKPDIFAYFIKKGMRWSHKILIYAVVNDNHYIYEHITHGDYISDERMYNASCAAAYTGNLKYLIRILDKLQKNIPITKLQYKSMMHMAISKDRYECIKYLHKHAGCYIKGQRTRSMI